MQGSSKRWLAIGAVLVVFVAVLLFVGMRVANGQAQKTPTATGQVTRGLIQAVVESSAALQPAADLTLTFGSGGTLAALGVKEGDRVAKGQVIASLDTSELQLSVTQAEANVKSAQAKLDALKAPPQAKDVLTAEANVKSAQAKLADLTAGATTYDTANASAALLSAQAKLNSVKSGPLPQDLANAQSALISAQAKLAQLRQGPTAADLASARASLASAQAKLDALKQPPTAAQLSAAQLKVTQAQTNLTKTQSSSAVSKQNAEIALDQADHAVKNAQDKYYAVAADALDSNGNLLTSFPSSLRGKYKDLTDLVNQYNAALRALQDAEDNYRKAQLALDDARQAEIQSLSSAQAQLDDANKQLQDLTSGPTAADLASAEAAVTQAQSSLDKLNQPPAQGDLASAQSAVDQAQNNLDKLKQPPTAADLTAAQAGVIQAQANLDKLKQPPTSADLASAQKAVEQAQAGLTALNAGPLLTDIETAQAGVAQAQASLDVAKLKVQEATLVAPFNGIIADVPVTPGQSVGAATTIAELVDDSSYHLDMNVGETDISQIKVGQPVDLTFDALAGDTYTGTVTFVAPKATVQQGVVTYLATVTLDPKVSGSVLRPGMSSTAGVIVNRRDNVLMVPNRAVRTEGAQKVVYVVGPSGGQIRVPIETGISDVTSTEIVGDSPLREGDSVVVGSVPSTGARTGGGLINFGGGARPGR